VAHVLKSRVGNVKAAIEVADPDAAIMPNRKTGNIAVSQRPFCRRKV
jgi:hypothetical protein